MADDYLNPQALQNPNQVPSNPFWSGVLQDQGEKEAAPFIDMARQSRGMDLQRQAIETGEFADPRSVRARMSGKDLEAVKNESEANLVPQRAGAESKKISEELRALPHITDANIAKAKQLTNLEEGTPFHALHATLGALYPSIHDKPLTEQMQGYANAINRWQTENPNIKLPAQFDPKLMMDQATFQKSILPDMQHMFLGGLNDPKQVGAERLKTIEGNYGLAREDQQQTGANYRAEVGADAHRYAADAAARRLELGETPQRAVARLRRELSGPAKNDPEKLEEYRTHIEDQWGTNQQRDPALTMLRIQSMTAEKPEQQAAAQKKYDDARWKFFSEKGIVLPLMVKGKLRTFKGGFSPSQEQLNDPKNWN